MTITYPLTNMQNSANCWILDIFHRFWDPSVLIMYQSNTLIMHSKCSAILFEYCILISISSVNLVILYQAALSRYLFINITVNLMSMTLTTSCILLCWMYRAVVGPTFINEFASYTMLALAEAFQFLSSKIFSNYWV